MGDDHYEPIGGGDINSVLMPPPPRMDPTPAPKKSVGEKYVPPSTLIDYSGPTGVSPTEESGYSQEFAQSQITKSEMSSGFGTDTKKSKKNTKRNTCSKLFMVFSIICFFISVLSAVGFALLFFDVVKF